ncbi:hypothetical protein B7463_g8984, partial [Scytalidium lignicola]
MWKKQSAPLQITQLQAFGPGSWIENLAIRPNGQILVARFDIPEVILVDPTNKLPPITIAAWNATEYSCASGITETTPDMFYVELSAPHDATFLKTGGTCSIFKIDMRKFKATTSGAVISKATVTKTTDILDADFLNGLDTLDDTHLLAGDKYNEWVYNVDVRTGEHHITIDDPKMKATTNATRHLGIDGLKIRDNFLYWTNVAAGSYNKIRISERGEPIGSSMVISPIVGLDDFVFRADGTAFLAQSHSNEIMVLRPGSSTPTVIAGAPTSTLLAGVTAIRFGRTLADRNRLYVTTSGAQGAPINGTLVVPGTVSYVDLHGY